jgi:Family of unknown function (DUF6493)
LSLADDLKAAAKRGDLASVVDLIENATEKQRRAAAPRMERFGIMRDAPAWRLAWLGTATAREVSTWWVALDDLPFDVVLRVVRARGKQFLDTLVRALERDELLLWPLIRAAVREGLIERPDVTAYTRALVAAAGLGERYWNEDSAYQALIEDAALLEEDVWRIFEVDVGQELVNARVYEREGGETLGKPVGNCWLYALTRLSAERRLDRQRLLDASLAALQRDFRASFVGWYAKLHEALEPTREERAARLETYLALLASPVPAVVKEGVTALKELDAQPEQLARAAGPALTQPQKGLALDVLRLLARAAEDEPAVLETVADALAHERADVQERALALLEQHRDQVDRAALLRYVDAVSPTLRPRLEALTGFSVGPSVDEAPEHPAPARTQPAPSDTARQRQPLAPVATVDDLIELAAALLEDQGTGDDAERFLDGVSRLCAEQDRDFERRTAALAKRAEELTEFNRWVTGIGGTQTVGRVVLAWTRRKTPPKHTTGDLLGFIAARALEVARRAYGGGKPRPLLALPTGSGGWIDPAVLEERRARHGRFRNRPDPADLQQAMLRASALEPIRIDPAVAISKSLYGGEKRGVKLSLASAPAELSALRDRLVPADEALVAGWDTSGVLGIRWALTVLPSDPEPAYGHALRNAVDSRDRRSAYGHPEIVLEHALQPGVPITRLGWHAVAAGLLGKPQEVQRAAVDVLVHSVGDGRFEGQALAIALAWLVANDLGKPNRLERPLRDAGRVSSRHAAEVVRTIVGFTAALPATPRTLAPVLELAQELAAASGYRVDGGAEQVALERITHEMSKSSKLGRAARGLLGSPA